MPPAPSCPAPPMSAKPDPPRPGRWRCLVADCDTGGAWQSYVPEPCEDRHQAGIDLAHQHYIRTHYQPPDSDPARRETR